MMSCASRKPAHGAEAGRSRPPSGAKANSASIQVRRAITAPPARGQRGAGLEIAYGFHDSPFGVALVMVNEGKDAEGLCGLAFASHHAEKLPLATGMRSRWPKAVYREAPLVTSAYADRVFSPDFPNPAATIDIVLYGSPFETAVWEALLAIPMGASASYSDIAAAIGAPLAVRAVGAAIGRNPLAYVAPCHRVLRKDGGLGGYRWGAARKQAMLKWEEARLSRLPGGGQSGQPVRNAIGKDAAGK